MGICPVEAVDRASATSTYQFGDKEVRARGKLHLDVKSVEEAIDLTSELIWDSPGPVVRADFRVVPVIEASQQPKEKSRIDQYFAPGLQVWDTSSETLTPVSSEVLNDMYVSDP